MSSCVSKIMERIINERLMWWAERHGILDNWQNSFQKGRSCLDNLARVKIEVNIAPRTGERIAIAFLDINAAYDSVTRARDILTDKLIEEGCPTRLWKYIEEWMTDKCTNFVLSKAKEVHYVVNKGLPQGGVLSSLLYAIYTKDILIKINPQMKQYNMQTILL